MDYTNHDYETLVSELTTRFAQVEGWGDAYQTSTGQRLIQLFADTTDSLMFMLERRSQEAFIDTAVLKNSVIAHASELGYRTRRTVAMTGSLNLILKDSQGNTINANDDIVIPKYTKVIATVSGVEFRTVNEVVIKAGSSSAVVDIKEGTLRTITVNTSSPEFLATRDYVIQQFENIDEYSLSVTDSDEVYYDVDSSEYNLGSLAFAEPSDPVYDIKYAIEGMRIVFGDDQFGKKPSGVLKIQYIQSNLISNSITSTGVKFNFESPILTDVSGNIPVTEYNYDMVNTTTIRGFSPVEDIKSIADNAKESIRSNKRTVIRADYEYLGSRSAIGGIVDVNVYGEQFTNSLIFGMNNVYMVYATSDGIDLNITQKKELDSYMSKYKPVTTHIVSRYADIIEAVCNVKIRKNTRLPQTDEEAYLLIKSRMEAFFALNKESIGGNVYHSDLIDYLHAQTVTINNINYHIVDFVNVEMASMYNIGGELPLYSVNIALSDSYVISAGDIWSVTVNDTVISVTVVGGDTKSSILERMRSSIATNIDVITMTTTVDGDEVIRLRSKFVNDYITISLGSEPINEFVSLSNIIRIPSSTMNFNDFTDVVIKGSVEVLDSDLNVVFLDDGLGNLVPTSGGANAKINYTNFDITSLYLTDTGNDYYVRFKQNPFQNIEVNDSSVIGLSPFAETINDPVLYSTIEFV